MTDKPIRSYTCSNCKQEFETDKSLEEVVKKSVAEFGNALLEGPPQRVCDRCYRALMRDHARKN